MEYTYTHRELIIENKVFTALDEFVSNFTQILEKYTQYVIVSGYVAILFGRARGTEDIDTIINPMNRTSFVTFYQELTEEEYYFLNPENENGLYGMLQDQLGVRIAEKDFIIPNIELKFLKDDFDRYSIENRIKVMMGNKNLFISPIEIQIPYKLYLGSDKDIEDAVYLWNLFKGKIDIPLFKEFMEEFNIRGGPYGIEI